MVIFGPDTYMILVTWINHLSSLGKTTFGAGAELLTSSRAMLSSYLTFSCLCWIFLARIPIVLINTNVHTSMMIFARGTSPKNGTGTSRNSCISSRCIKFPNRASVVSIPPKREVFAAVIVIQSTVQMKGI